MKKSILIAILVLFSGISVQAQEEFAKNGAYFELGGNGGLYSINYERFLSSNVSIRGGFASFSTWGIFFNLLAVNITTFPVLVNYFYGTGSHKLELGAGVLLGTSKVTSALNNQENKSSAIFDLTAVVGYRYQKPEGGIIFRAGLTPFLALTGEEDEYPQEGFTLSGGISIGYAF